MDRANFEPREATIKMRSFKNEDTGKVAMISDTEGCGVLVFADDEHCAKKDVIPALRAACVIKNIMLIDNALKQDKFGYRTKNDLSRFSEDNLEFEKA